MPKIFCTQTATHIVNENLPEKGLKYLTEHILGVPKDKIKKYEEVEPGTQEFRIYGMNDAIWTYQLYQKFNREIYKQNLTHLFYDIEMPFQKVLMELQINGIGADINAARQMTYEVQHLYYEIENTLLNAFGGRYDVWITPRSRVLYCEPSINFNSSDQVVPLIEGLGFEIFEKSKKQKKKSWNKASKNRLKGKHELIDLLIKYGKVEKLLSTFLRPFGGFINEDGRIRCSFHNTVAVTGRLSCSSPNIEQLPKQNSIANIRNLFISSADSVYIVADYKGQELRILGEETQDPTLKKGLIAGLDIHQENADEFTGGDRDKAKSISFGVAYGKQAYGFSKDFGCSQAKAQEFLDRFFNKYPIIKLRIAKCREQVYRHGYVSNMSGRRRRFPDFHKKSKWQKERCYRQAFNFLIQSYGADVVKVAATEIIKDIKLKIVNLVHDEIVVECPKTYVEQGTKYIRKCMISALPMSIPWEVDIGTGERYGECK